MRVPHTRLWQGDASGGDALIRDFLVADVFTDTPLEGNQLGIFPDGRGLSDELMLKATREMNFSETVFFEPPEHDGADARVRIFTPGGEIPFAGHPTLGSAWVLCEILGKQTVTLSTGAGPVPVELDMDGRHDHVRLDVAADPGLGFLRSHGRTARRARRGRRWPAPSPSSGTGTAR